MFSISTLRKRNLSFHRRMHFAVGLGVLAGSAALTGALIVGDSMRGSLTELALRRLGNVDYALLSHRFFRIKLAGDIEKSAQFADHFQHAAPAILLSGSATHADTRARVNKIDILGINQDFLTLSADAASQPLTNVSGRRVILNQALATELQASAGDDVLLRLGKPSNVPTEIALGRRDDTVVTLRLTVDRVIPGDGLGGFSLQSSHRAPRNAYVAMKTLQRALDQSDRVNALLVTAQGRPTSGRAARLDRLLKSNVRLEDAGLRLRADHERNYVALESKSFLIEPAVERAARSAADDIGTPVGSVLTYLANAISTFSGEVARSVPYSTVTALDAVAADSAGLPSPQPGTILLNKWAADDLGVSLQDEVELAYYLTDSFGQLKTHRSSFTVAAAVAMTRAAADPGFTPPYPGVTDSRRISDWDPPFPMDLKRIRDVDERYWDEYRTSPKAFVSLEDGQRIWSQDAERFGRLTSLRITPPGGMTLDQTAAAWEKALLEKLDLAELGLRFDPVRERALAAGKGSTDFGGLFIGFSFFLIAAAAMLVALLFRLGVERRAQELGLLLASGFTPRRIARLLIAEGAVVAGLGSVAGLLGAFGYAWLMLAGLRTWWHDAVNTPLLTLHLNPVSLCIGLAGSIGVALLSIVWSLHSVSRISTASLMAGNMATEQESTRSMRRRFSIIALLVSLSASGAIWICAFFTDVISEEISFFIGGSLLLVAAVATCHIYLCGDRRGLIKTPGWTAWVQLGTRNAPRHVTRSTLTIGLIASATFVIAALQAFRIDAGADTTDKSSGTGGFTHVGESVVGLPYDLNTPTGRRSLSLSQSTVAALADTDVTAFRLRPGDQSSCLNLYLPDEPRIVGATDKMIDRGGFAFSSHLAQNDAQADNPWSLLRQSFADGAIPAIGDEAAVKWQLHSGLGEDFVITNERGRDVRLRFVALLSKSLLQDELVVSESNFKKLFPSQSGYSFFLIESAADDADDLAAVLERELERFSFDLSPAGERLERYFAVQNTYLSTFQTLGGLGLVLGTVGLAAVLLRNVWERRCELALMRALGFSSAAIAWIVLSENALLVVAGLVAGVVPAMIAVMPALLRDPSTLQLPSLAATLLLVFTVGMLAPAVALRSYMRAPLLPQLRAE